MAIGTPVSIGTAQNKTAGTDLVITVPAGGVPAGAMIVVCWANDNNGGVNDNVDAISDTAGNSYDEGLVGQGFVRNADGVNAGIAFALNVGALSSGNTITLAGNSGAAAKAAAAFYVTGIATSSAKDQGGTATGTDTTPSVSTSAGTTQADEITIGIVGTEGPSGDTFTQDASPAYATPPVRIGTTGAAAASNITLAGGYFIETATGTKTYNPTLGTSRDWAAVIATFKGDSNKTLAADAGSHAITGTAAGTQLGRVVVADAGSYALSGQDATLVLDIPLVADAGSHVITGSTAALEFDRQIVADAGSHAITGSAATLSKGLTLNADAGAYAITGADAALEFDRQIIAAAGSHVVSGSDAGLEFARFLTADAGSYNITGADATLVFEGGAPAVAPPDTHDPGWRYPGIHEDRPRKHDRFSRRELMREIRIAAGLEQREPTAAEARLVENIDLELASDSIDYGYISDQLALLANLQAMARGQQAALMALAMATRDEDDAMAAIMAAAL